MHCLGVILHDEVIEQLNLHGGGKGGIGERALHAARDRPQRFKLTMRPISARSRRPIRSGFFYDYAVLIGRLSDRNAFQERAGFVGSEDRRADHPQEQTPLLLKLLRLSHNRRLGHVVARHAFFPSVSFPN
jgi:hypothetical protein